MSKGEGRRAKGREADERREAAEALYAAHVGTWTDERDLDIETLVARYPEQEAELREVHADWGKVSGVYAALSEARSFDERLRQYYGDAVDSGLELEPKPGKETHGSSPSDMLKRLQVHAPKRSRFQLLGELARGGMGAILRVWDPDLRRTLAMKVVLGRGPVKEAAGTTPPEERALSRFLEEAQVTGQLDHPGVVPVHELGLDAEGRVYFTMRLVKGRNLEHIFDLVHKEKDGWSRTRAVRVLLKVCEAMAYAHNKRVIHRDLKPSNVMVGRFGEVYVMDWGLARVMGREDTKDIRVKSTSDTFSLVTSAREEAREEARESADDGSELITMDGDVVGTPAYMSPEQARGELHRMDQRSDVYSIGAILYHLIAGYMPYAREGSVLNSYVILNLVQLGPPESLHGHVPDAPAELVAICEKAMAREPEDRYASMHELSEDLSSYLDGHVVRAFETGAVAEFKKWVRRNKATAFASAAAVVVALGGLGGMSYVQASANETLEDKNEEVRAERDAGDRVIEFMLGVFESPDPQESRGDNITAKELLDAGAHSIDWELDQDPQVAARMRSTMGKAYLALGLYDDAKHMLDLALEARSDLPDAHEEKLRAKKDLAHLYRAVGKYDESMGLYEEVLGFEREALGDDARETLATRNELAKVHSERGLYDDAERLYEEVLADQERVLGEVHDDTLKTRVDLALLHRDRGRTDDAMKLFQQTLDAYRQKEGDDHPLTLEAMHYVASIHVKKQEWDKAETLFKNVVEGREEVLPENHPDTLVSKCDLGVLFLGRGRISREREDFERAVGYLEPAYAACKEKGLSEEHPTRMAILSNLAAGYLYLRRFQEAIPLLESAHERLLQVRGEKHLDTIGAKNALAASYFAVGRGKDAENYYFEALDGFDDGGFAKEHPDRVQTLFNLAVFLNSERGPEKALEFALEALEHTPEGHPELPVRRGLVEEIESAQSGGG